MLYFNFSLTNPWFKSTPGSKKQDYCNILLKHGAISKELLENKHWELEVIFDRRTILRTELSLSFRNRDHAGLEIGFCFLGYDLAFRVYDIRHWNSEKNTWESKENQNS